MSAALSALDGPAARGLASTGPASRRRGVIPYADAEFFGSPRLVDIIGRNVYREWQSHPSIYGAVNAFARNIKTVPWRFWTGDDDSPKQVTGGQWEALFDRPNPLTSTAQFWGLSIYHLLTCSKGLCVYKQGRGPAIEPDETPIGLWPMSGKLFDPVLDPRDDTKLLGWRSYVTGVGMKVYAPHEVVFVRIEDDRGWWTSLTPLEALKRVVDVEGGADEHNAAFFRNGATIGGVVELPEGYTEDQVDEKDKSNEDKHGGSMNAHRLMYLSGGMKFIPNGVSQRDMEFLGQKEFNREEIRTAFWGLPKSEMGLDVDVNMVTGAGAQSSDRGAWTRCYVPVMRLLRDSMYQGLFWPVEKGRLWGAFDESTIEALRANLSTKTEQARELMGLGVTLNEANRLLGMGLEENDAGDVRYMDSSLVLQGEPLTEDEAEPTPTPTPTPKNEPEEPERGATREAETWWGAPGLSEDQQREVTAAADAYLREVHQPMESRFNSTYRRGLMKARGDALSRVRGDDGGPAFDVERAMRYSRRELGAVYRKAMERATSRLDKDLDAAGYKDPPPPLPRAFVEKQTATRMKFIDRGTKAIERAVTKSVTEGKRAGETVEQLERRVKDVFNAAARKSTVVARTEVSSVANAARVKGMRAAGVEDIQWITQQDERVRPSHAAQHGLWVELGGTFPNGLRYPMDPAAPEDEILGCRCSARPAPKQAPRASKDLTSIFSPSLDAALAEGIR